MVVNVLWYHASPNAEEAGFEGAREDMSDGEKSGEAPAGNSETEKPVAKPFYRLQNGATCPKIFVGGLAWETTVEVTKDYFTKFGTVVDVIMPRDRETGRSRGFG